MGFHWFPLVSWSTLTQGRTPTKRCRKMWAPGLSSHLAQKELIELSSHQVVEIFFGADLKSVSLFSWLVVDLPEK
jgi:hypothetical protein